MCSFSVFFEPTDRRKATKIIHCKRKVFCSTPNLSELQAMARFIEPNSFSAKLNSITDIYEILELAKIVSKCIDNLVITMGAKGVITVKNQVSHKNISQNKSLEARFYDVKVLDNVESVSGAGDCFASGFIYGILSGYKEAKSISIAIEVAKSALLCNSNVPNNLKVPCEDNEAKYKIISN